MQVLGMFTNAGQAIRPWRGSWALSKVYWEAVFIYPLLKLFMDACLSRELQMGSNAEFSFSPKTAFLDIKQWTLWAEALRKGKWKLFISRSSSSLKPGLCVLGFSGMFQKLELNSKLLNIGHPFGFRQLWLTLMTRRWVWIWNLGAYMIDFEQCLSALGLPPPLHLLWVYSAPSPQFSTIFPSVGGRRGLKHFASCPVLNARWRCDLMAGDHPDKDTWRCF